MPLGTNRDVAQRYPITLSGRDPGFEHGPLREAMEWRQSFVPEESGEFEATGQTKALRDLVRRSDGTFGQHDGFHDSAREQRHIGAEAANGRE